MGASESKTVEITRNPATGAFGIATERDSRSDISGLARLGSKTWWVDRGTDSVGWNNAGSGTPSEAEAAHEYVVASAHSDLVGMTATDARHVWTVEQKSGLVQRFDTEPLLPVWRYGGADRYEMSSRLQSSCFPYPTQVFIASGEVFADALSVGAIAARHQAPLLLTSKTGLPFSTEQVLRHWQTVKQITVVGGPASIPDSVLAELQNAQPGAMVVRIGGRDRYEVSRTLVQSHAPSDGASVLYVADGRNFPDALSSTSAAAYKKGVVLLVDGGSTLPAKQFAVVRAIADTGKPVTIVGGPNSVSPTVESQLALVAHVNRLGGADRYAVSQAVNDDAYHGRQSTLFIASGGSFADALTGGVPAGLRGEPLYLAPQSCVPTELVQRIRLWHPELVLVLGGPNTLSPDVQTLTRCRSASRALGQLVAI